MDRILLEITVRPGSKELKLVRTEEGYEFFTPEPARQGRANASLLKYLRREFKAREVRILKGAKDRKKLVLIVGPLKFKREG